MRQARIEWDTQAMGTLAPRINLTPSVEASEVLERLSAASGKAKARLVRELLEGLIPELQVAAEALEAARESELRAITVLQRGLHAAMQGGTQMSLELRRLQRTKTPRGTKRRGGGEAAAATPAPAARKPPTGGKGSASRKAAKTGRRRKR